MYIGKYSNPMALYKCSAPQSDIVLSTLRRTVAQNECKTGNCMGSPKTIKQCRLWFCWVSGWVYSAWGSYSTCAMFYAFCGRGMCNVWSEQYKRWSAVHFGSETERKTTIPPGECQPWWRWNLPGRILRWFDWRLSPATGWASQSRRVGEVQEEWPKRASSVTAFQTMRVLELRDRYRRTESSRLLEEFMLDTCRHKSVPVEEMLALALKAVSLITTDSGLNSVQIDTSWWFQWFLEFLTRTWRKWNDPIWMEQNLSDGWQKTTN